jgi:hypothetical protein
VRQYTDPDDGKECGTIWLRIDIDLNVMGEQALLTFLDNTPGIRAVRASQ